MDSDFEVTGACIVEGSITMRSCGPKAGLLRPVGVLRQSVCARFGSAADDDLRRRA